MMHRASIPASTASPIVRVLNRDVGRYHRWCTPSILPDQERVEDFYASDISPAARTGSSYERWRWSAPTPSCSWLATSTTRSSTR
jgi:hypothetical protein